MKKILILIVLLTLTNCSKLEFNNFDPWTSTAKWILTKDK